MPSFALSKSTAPVLSRRRSGGAVVLLAGRAWWFLALAGILAGALWSQAAETLPPKPDRYFNDYAHVVDESTALTLNERLAQFERETSNQFVVAVYPKMESSSSVDDFTQRIAQSWGVGQSGRRNGVVLFVFVQDHQMFIQTGYGLEGALPDATCFEIIRNVIAPRFKEGNYAAGLTNGIDAIIAATKGEYRGSGHTKAESSGSGAPLPFGFLIFIIILFVLFALSRAGRRRRRGYWFSGLGGPYIGGWSSGGSGWSGGSSGGGGFSGFSSGGGSFGGGGAGGSW